MPTVTSAAITVNDYQARYRQVADSTDQLSAPIGAAVMPVDLGLTDTKPFHRFSQFSEVALVAQGG
jgi:hypothetical protein